MTKVTFVTGEYPPMQGGIADYTANLAKHIIPLTIDPSVLISQRWATVDTSSDINQDVPIHPALNNWGWRCWPQITAFLAQHQPDIIHIQYQAAAFDLGGWVNWLPWYLKKRRIPVRIVTTFHDLRIPYIFPKAGRFRWQSMIALARYSDAVICTNREDLQSLDTNLPSHHIKQFSVNPDGQADKSNMVNQKPSLTLIPLGNNVEPSPPSDFDRVAWRQQLGLATGSLLLAYFGFLNESKGGEELIDALAALRQQGIDAHLLFIGGDVGDADPTNAAYAQRVQTLIANHHLTDVVHRTGYVDLSQISANLLAADAVVMPYRDGVSFRRTTLIAALRHGCPIVTTFPADATTTPEIQPGETMLLAQPHNATSLAETIAPLANNPQLRQRLSKGARELGDLFEWGSVAGQTATLYNTIITRKIA